MGLFSRRGATPFLRKRFCRSRKSSASSCPALARTLVSKVDGRSTNARPGRWRQRYCVSWTPLSQNHQRESKTKNGYSVVPKSDRPGNVGLGHARRSCKVADANVNCTKCKARMEEGFSLTLPRGRVESWVSGAPDWSVWWGLNLKGKKRVPVRTFRCTACGYLECFV
jgi:hypothetical protein